MKEIFKKFRNHLGLTQKELADKLEISRAAIAQIEAGNNNVSYELLHKIKNIFNVNLEELEIANGYLNNKISNNLYNPNYNLNEESDINYKSKVDYLNSNVEFFTKMILDNNLSLLYNDNMKTIYFTASLLQNKGYSFKKKEKEKMLFYEGIGELLSDLHTGEEKTTDIVIENLTHIIRVDMFRFIGNLMWQAQKQVGFNVSYRFEDIFNGN